jgi:type I restriction enzyme R subunit
MAAPDEGPHRQRLRHPRDDFDYAELADKGGLQKAWGLFGKELDTLMDEMNGELVA